MPLLFREQEIKFNYLINHIEEYRGLDKSERIFYIIGVFLIPLNRKKQQLYKCRIKLKLLVVWAFFDALKNVVGI